ncbi:thymocyte selection-associated high mobility group box protein TOX isoform X6 [Callorhinchus milii]|uniref:thymocyte selection-associated high mobility group box protein TOX isoform X6 n=1 Tax=Callorhinchus milii TaxID=7868 RepID=UPI001C3FA49F|nr:thymocyte selection-associated high mobility group box protein TOX isoform X6 [Callorhinchus milii]
MDVRFYPQAAQANISTDTPCLGPAPCLDPYYCNKFDGENMYMSMTDPSQDFMPGSQGYSKHGEASSPCGSAENPEYHLPYAFPGMTPKFLLCASLSQNVATPAVVPRVAADSSTLPKWPFFSYPVPSIGDEDFDIPPITPPTMPDHSLVHLSDAESAYHSICHSVPQNGLLPFNPQNMNLPAITVSNMLGQDGALLSNCLSVMNGGEKRAAVDVGKKPKTPKKKKKKDPNEPQKPVSAYALFFRDTQAAIKGQNPNATFGEVSKIVASMWDGLGEEQKQVYKKKTEAAKKEYLKQLAAYRASLVSKSYNDPADTKNPQAPQIMNSKQSVFPGPPQAPSSMYLGSGAYHQQPGMNPHISAMHPNLSRSIAPKPSGQMPVTVSIANMAVSPPPPLQISPPLHQQLSMQQHQLHQQQTSAMSQQIGNHQLPMQVQAPLHSPTMQQSFNLQSEFQNIINSTSTAAPVATPAMDCVRSGCRNPPPQSVDWNDYCNNGSLQRDKSLYLT